MWCQEIETWVEALAHYDNNEFEESIRVFDEIADTSKILFNCGVIHATLGEHDKAVECYQRAIQCDQYLAVAYFQQGVSNFLVGDFEEALANFNDALLYLRGNTYIDYDQLGLKFRLYSCEVLFNRGLCYIYLNQEKPGMQDFGYAQKEKMTADHDVIDDAISEKAEGYTVFSIPVGIVYRPNEAKVKNLKTKDYLGKARLIATSNTTNISTGFQGAEKKAAMMVEMAAKDDRPAEQISFAAQNLVQRNLSSRLRREESAPPAMSRNVFPPTPPPESDKTPHHNSVGSIGLGGRSSSLRDPASRTKGPPRQDSDQNLRPGNLTRANTTTSSSSGRSPNMDQGSWNMGPYPDRTRGPPYRTTSESRPSGPPRGMSVDRAQYQRSAPQGPPRDPGAYGRAPLFRETTSQRQMAGSGEDDTCDDIYRSYSQREPSSGRKPQGRRPKQHHQYIDEEDESTDQTAVNSVNSGEFGGADSGNFEMIGGQITPTAVPPTARPSPGRSGSRRPEMRKIRVKVHFNDDTRYIMIGPSIEYGDFESKIREKFSIKLQLKIKMQDDGDMITMGDQDDLEMLLQSVKNVARKERNDMGKMEVSMLTSCSRATTNSLSGLGPGNDIMCSICDGRFSTFNDISARCLVWKH
jgi:tetratricopeptide (TPR) repeat protein